MITVQVVGQASRLPDRASLPRWCGRGRDAPMAGEPPAPLPEQLRQMKTACGMRGRSCGQSAYLLLEALVYIAVVMTLLGAAYAAMYRCVDSSIALRRNADDITSALHAGERWRADVRGATGQVRVEDTDAGQLLHLEGPHGAVVYRFATNSLFRSVRGGPWTRLLESVKSSTMTANPRQFVTAWRWEFELQPHGKGSVKPSRLRPLFTFLAVPERPASK